MEKESNGSSGLLIERARRVGKTMIAEYFGENEFPKYRTIDFKNDTPALAGWVPKSLLEGSPQFLYDYHDYYKAERGYHPRSLNSNGGWNVTAPASLLNTRLFTYASEIRNAVMIVYGENAYSLYFGQDAFKLLKGDNKEFLLVKDANHCNLYVGGINHDKIPFNKIEEFIKKNI